MSKTSLKSYLATVSLVLCMLLYQGCGGSSVQATQPPPPPPSQSWPLTEAQIQKLLSTKYFFGHQSVGGNILEGIADLMAADSRLKLNIVHSSNPSSVSGPAFVEYPVGTNGDPASKDADFAAIMDSGFGAQGGVGMYKYCYVDISDSTDVQAMFNHYRAGVDSLKSKYSKLTIVHITAPLMTDPSVKRDDYNNLLRQTYGAAPIFDLAIAESTHADGSRSFATVGSKTVYTLASEYTDDGGHLNATGRQWVAKKMLITLANL